MWMLQEDCRSLAQDILRVDHRRGLERGGCVRRSLARCQSGTSVTDETVDYKLLEFIIHVKETV